MVTTVRLCHECNKVHDITKDCPVPWDDEPEPPPPAVVRPVFGKPKRRPMRARVERKPRGEVSAQVEPGECPVCAARRAAYTASERRRRARVKAERGE